MNELFEFWKDWMHYTLFDWSTNRIGVGCIFFAGASLMWLGVLSESDSAKPVTHFLIGTFLLALCTALWPISVSSLIVYGIVVAIEQLIKENEK